MTRSWLILPALVALAACARDVPDDTGEGVGFGDYASYQNEQRRIAQARLDGQPPSILIPGQETVVPPSNATASSDLDLEARVQAAIDQAEAGTPVATAPSSNPGISDEQDFDAVAARETIETDAERLARMAEQRVEVAPTALPERPNASGPNIVEYALSTTHPVGQQMYRRTSFNTGRHEQNCLSYQSDDLAQQAFLAMGGPERDRQALDPDGDGYACNWNPNIYRNAARAG